MKTVDFTNLEKPVQIGVFWDNPQKNLIKIKAIDLDNPLTIYIDRDLSESACYVPLPIFPKNLRVYFSSENPNLEGKFWLENLKTTPYGFDQDSFLFYDFAAQFAKNASYLPEGIYESENKKFHIDYSNLIVDKMRDYSRVLETPARVDRDWGTIELSKFFFDKISVQKRMFLLLHEFFHYKNQTTNEFEADMEAAKLYKAMGFSSFEALTILCDIFIETANSEQAERAKQLYNFLISY